MWEYGWVSLSVCSFASNVTILLLVTSNVNQQHCTLKHNRVIKVSTAGDWSQTTAVSACGVRAAADTRDSHNRTPRNSKPTRIFWNVPRVRAESHATKPYLAVERPQVTRVERTGPVLFCAACGCAAANHSSGNSRRGPRTKWQTARTSPIQK